MLETLLFLNIDVHMIKEAENRESKVERLKKRREELKKMSRKEKKVKNLSLHNDLARSILYSSTGLARNSMAFLSKNSCFESLQSFIRVKNSCYNVKNSYHISVPKACTVVI